MLERLVDRGGKGGATRIDPEAASLLDQAVEYEYHEGPLDFEEEDLGEFWSIQCKQVSKTFGRNRVLAGLNLGIPEGMITVILGPSGTGKSVLIKHLIGLRRRNRVNGKRNLLVAPARLHQDDALRGAC